VRIGRAGNSKNIFNKSRVVNLISALKTEMDFGRIKFFTSPLYNTPPSVLFMGPKGATLYVNKKRLMFDFSNKPVYLKNLIDHSALVIKNEKDFKNRGQMKASSCLGFVFDFGSRWFLVADAQAGMSHHTLMGGLLMLKDANALDTKLDILIKGVFKLGERGEILSAKATLFNSTPRLAEDKKLMRHLFYEMALGLKCLGCSGKMEIRDMAPPLRTMENFLERNSIASLGDIIEKFSPPRLSR